MIIAKAPAMYGFRNLKPLEPYKYHYFTVPGGTDLYNLANYLGVKNHQLKQLNPDLVKGFIPKYIGSHRIRIPEGLIAKASSFIKEQYQ
jgi:membrane-bound lytic murein transglycosylase D